MSVNQSSEEGVGGVENVLRKAREYVAAAAEPQHGYGFFGGGDPRDFHPDLELCSPEEIAAHKAACEAADAADGATQLPCESGWIAPGIHVTKSSFGIGGYTMRDPEAATLAEIDKVLSSLTQSAHASGGGE